jgi:DNA mismatch repair protein MutS2
MLSLESTAVHDGVPAQQSASTPSPFREAEFPAAEALEFPRVLEVIAGYAAGPLGANRLRSRRPSADPVWVRSELETLAELRSCYKREKSLEVTPVPELASILERLRIPGSVLEGPELVDIRRTFSAGRATTAELRRIESDAPTVAGWMVPVPGRDLEKRLSQTLDDEGQVQDSASPALLKARRAVQDARTRLVKKLEAVLRGATQSDEGTAEVTIRNGRYVIPVRRDSRARLDGIVHDESATGETLFLEPTAAIGLGNQLRRAVVDAEREVMRVLRDLSEALRPHAEAIHQLHTVLVALDDLNARARYAHAVDGEVPALRNPGEGMVLVRARHPLLLARGIETVPFDLDLAGSEPTLLISGPNAGGKTVLLKTIGLAQAMVQSGIAPPLGLGSAIPVLRRIVADIGDHQSIAADLSTFSAHLAVLRDLLSTADDGTLVLVDEIGSGTDPSEGGALAAAALTTLTRRGARTVATTHLGALKALATQVPGIVNGSLQFDPDQLAPTFRFAQGTPGRSYGIAMAKRLGLPREVVADAETRVSGVERSLDTLLEAAERRERELSREQAELAGRLAAAEREGLRLAEELGAQQSREAELRARERGAEQRARAEAKRVMLDARSRIEEALEAARKAVTEEAASEARRRLETAIREESEALLRLEPDPESAPGGPARLEEGQRVRLRAGGTGRVIEQRGDGKVVVVAGNVRLVVDAQELAAIGNRQSPTGTDPQPDPRLPTAESRLPSLPASPAASEIDLRGMRADEAESAAFSALDAAILDDLPSLRIIHGHGTGALREVVRRILTQDRRIASFRAAAPNQGGTGVTVVEFAP